MWRFKSMAVSGVILGALILGATIAHGGWSWNAAIDVEGAEVRTAWTVVDDPNGEYNYFTKITLKLPLGAESTIIEQSNTETVVESVGGNLECTADGIEARVAYNVKSQPGAVGTEVEVWVTADGQELTRRTHVVDDRFRTEKFLIPGVTCSGQ